MTETDERAIGRLEARVDTLTSTVGELRADVKQLTAALEQGRGMKTGLGWLVSVFSLIGGMLASAAAAALGLFRGH